MTPKKTILVMDDDPSTLEFFGEALGDTYGVEMASNADDAIQKLEKTRYDLLILDILVPRMNGFEICERAKSTVNREAPILLISGREKRRMPLILKKFGADDFLKKPLDVDILRSRVRRLIEDGGRKGIYRVLVVDDDEKIRKLLHEVFSAEHYTMRFAKTGKEALSIAGDFRPDLILLDVVMPPPEGWETCRVLRSMEATRGAKIVVMTGRTGLGDFQLAKQMGADGFVQKPFSIYDLLGRAEALLQTAG